MLKNGNGQVGPASDCFKFPTKCVVLRHSLDSSIDNIDPNTVTSTLASIQWIPTLGSYIVGWFWPAGSGNYFTYLPAYAYYDAHVTSIDYFNLTPQEMGMHGRFYVKGKNGNCQFNGNRTGDSYTNEMDSLRY